MADLDDLGWDLLKNASQFFKIVDVNQYPGRCMRPFGPNFLLSEGGSGENPSKLQV